MAIANLKKLQGYTAGEINQQDYNDSLKKYEESMKIFSSLKIYSGQAACSFAIGFVLYSKSSTFITKKMNENKIYDRAMKHLEKAVDLYSKVQHFTGEALCHKILSFIKKKLGENVRHFFI